MLNQSKAVVYKISVKKLRMRWLFFLIFNCTFLTLMADHESDYTSIEPPYITVGHQRLQEADKAWAKFQDQIEWLLQYRKVAELDPDNEDKKNEFNELKKERALQYKAFLECVTEAQDDFIKFRTKIANCALSNIGNSPDGFLNYTLSVSNVTDWYVNYMRKMLFPDDWKSLYEKSLKEKAGKSELK